MPPLSTIICTDCRTKSKGLFLLPRLHSARKATFFLYHTPLTFSVSQHTPRYVYFDMKVGLCEGLSCLKSLFISVLNSLFAQVSCSYMIQIPIIWCSIPLCLLFKFRFSWTTDFPLFPFHWVPLSLIVWVFVSWCTFFTCQGTTLL